MLNCGIKPSPSGFAAGFRPALPLAAAQNVKLALKGGFPLSRPLIFIDQILVFSTKKPGRI
jgi:hypothetical protein